MPRAEKDARQLSARERRRVAAGIDRFATTFEGDVVKLTAVEPAEYRLRVGDLRVRFSRDDEARVLTILRILPRDKAYRVRERMAEYGVEEELSLEALAALQEGRQDLAAGRVVSNEEMRREFGW